VRSPLFLILPLAGLIIAFFSNLLPAQTVGGTEDLKWRFDGQASSDNFGLSVSGAGDVDGDGFADLVVGAPIAMPNGLGVAGSAFVFSGSTGAQLWRFDGQAYGYWLGYSVAGAGDVDGDGFDDLIVGAPKASPSGLSNAGSAFVFSGATGAQLWRFDGLAALDELGYSVSGAGDVDGDGFDDLIVGTSFSDPNGLSRAGSAFVFSGATGAQLWRFDGQATGDQLGSSVSGAGDLDGDGFADLIVGAPGTDPNGLSDAGSAFIFAGSTGAPLWRFDGQAAVYELGWSVSGAGDVDGDGVGDVIMGAPGTGPNGLPGAGSAFVFSGATGIQLWRFDGLASGDFLGFSVAGAGDVDGDGFDDLIAGAWFSDPYGIPDAGSAFVFSGATGSQLLRLDGQARGDLFGSSVSGAGDVDGDGRADLIIGAQWADSNSTPDVGSAFVYTFNPILDASAEMFSVSAGGIIDYAIDFPDVDAGEEYRFLLSIHGTGPTMLQGLRIPLTRDRFFRSSMKGNTPPQGVGFRGILNGEGRALARFTAAPGSLPSKLIGRSLFLAVMNMKLDFSSVARRIDFVP